MKGIIKTTLVIFIMSSSCFSQEESSSNSPSLYARMGDFQFGMRTTTSLFGHENVPGFGVGGFYRIQALKFVNTEWFADWITLDLNGAGTRYNAHIGWSVMFYPKQFGKFIPYIMAGHCFDYARVVPLSTELIDRSSESLERWSSAIQMGLGSHYYLTDRFNISLYAQYMLHLGKHLEYELTDTGDGWYLDTSVDDDHASFEGHLLVTASLGYRIACLSKKNRRNQK